MTAKITIKQKAENKKVASRVSNGMSTKGVRNRVITHPQRNICILLFFHFTSKSTTKLKNFVMLDLDFCNVLLAICCVVLIMLSVVGIDYSYYCFV
jgi:hypothetical protein